MSRTIGNEAYYPALAEDAQMFVRILEDLPKIRDSDGIDRQLVRGELVKLPDSTARALISRGKAEILEVDGPPATAYVEAKKGIVQRTNCIPGSLGEDETLVESLSDQLACLNAVNHGPVDIIKQEVPEIQQFNHLCPDSIDGREGICQPVLKMNDTRTPPSRHTVKLLEIFKNEAEELVVIAEIDGERQGWQYDDLETELHLHPGEYPPLVVEMLQAKRNTYLAPKGSFGKGAGRSNASALRLVEMAKQDGKAEYFHDLARVPYARIVRGDHFEVKAIKEPEFYEWLVELNYDAEGLAPEDATAKRARDTLAVLASRGDERPVYLRHGEHDGAFYYDLCNAAWQAVKITAAGWEIVDDVPVMFRRYDHMRPQALPIRPTGRHWALKELVELANIGSTEREILEVQLHVLNVPGIEQMGAGTLGLEGTGKTTTQQLAVALADPSTDAESSLPKSKNDLSLHLSTHRLASFDNLTRITEDQSDDLSRSGTGASDTMRALYKDNDINRRIYRTPSFFNGITVTGAKPDFYDRNIIYRTHETFDGPRLSKSKLAARIKDLLPHALGEIFDNLSLAMRYKAEFSEEAEEWTPRMVDWYLWALAVAKSMDRPNGWFEGVLRLMIERRDYDAIADQPLTRALEFVARQRGFVGTATELYTHINDFDKDIPFACQIDRRDRNWPTSAGSLGMRIRPLMKSLKAHDVYIYKRLWSSLKKSQKMIKGLEQARARVDAEPYRDSDDIYIVSAEPLDLGREDNPVAGGK